MNFKDRFKDRFKDMYFNYSDATYTVKSYGLTLYSIPSFIKLRAPTAIITQVSFRNNRATYTKLKD